MFKICTMTFGQGQRNRGWQVGVWEGAHTPSPSFGRSILTEWGRLCPTPPAVPVNEITTC